MRSELALQPVIRAVYKHYTQDVIFNLFFGLKDIDFTYVYIHGSSAESLRAPRAHTQAQATKDFSFFATKKILKSPPT